MAATFVFQGSDQNGTDSASNPFDIGGSGASVNMTQARVWSTPVAGSPIPAGQNSVFRHVRAKFTGPYSDISNVKIWRSDGNALVSGVSILLGPLPAGAAYAVPTTSGTGDAAVPTSEPGSPNVNVDATGATRYAPALSGGADRWLRLQVATSSGTPAGAITPGTPQATLTCKYQES